MEERIEKILLALLVAMISLPLYAEQADSTALPYPAILTDMPNVQITQDSIVTQLMQEKMAGIERGEQEMAGYRVQIFSSNNAATAKAEALMLEERVKTMVNAPIYVLYSAPSWKVRLGDFRTQDEAQAFRQELRRILPELQDYTYVVRDIIKIAK